MCEFVLFCVHVYVSCALVGFSTTPHFAAHKNKFTMSRPLKERAARRLLRYKGDQPLPDHAHSVVDMIGYLELWATPERIADGRAAAEKQFQQQQACAKAINDVRMEKYKKGIQVIGKKNFERLVKDMAVMASKEIVVQKTYKIAKSAVNRYKKSREFQDEIKAALKAQKKLTAKQQTMAKIGELTTMLKGELKKLPPNSADLMVEKHGLQAIKKKLDESRKPELMPKWI